MHSFRSDNNAPICREALDAMIEASRAGHAPAYGADADTSDAVAEFRRIFGAACEVFFISTGTAANCLAIAALLVGRPWSRVLCHTHAHYNEDESTAPEQFTGCRTTTIAPARLALASPAIPASKLSPEDIWRAAGAASRGDVHQPAPGVLTLSNPTEFGEVYSPAETRALCDAAHQAGYLVHVDGARFANAAECVARSTGVAPEAAARALTIDAGVDAISFGGTKNGLATGEAVLFLAPALEPADPGAGPCALAPSDRVSRIRAASGAFPHLRKRSGHLISKHRFVSAPFAASLRTGAWARHSGAANSAARALDAGLRRLGYEAPFSADTNGVFVRLSEGAEGSLRAAMEAGALGGFYMFGHPAWRIARFMCSFDTRPEDVDALLALFARLPRAS